MQPSMQSPDEPPEPVVGTDADQLAAQRAPVSHVLVAGPGEDAGPVELLRGRGIGEASGDAPDSVLALAEELTRARSDLSGALERVVQSLDAAERRELLDEMLKLETQNPGAFLAGAMAGFALGRKNAAETRSTQTSVVSTPVDSAQTGPGGLGHLETPPPRDDFDR
jgi:hypothetical protein